MSTAATIVTSQPPPSASGSTSTTSLVLDIETLDFTPYAIITEIGVIAVNRATGHETACLMLRPNILEQLAAGRTYSDETIHFHFAQGSVPVLIGEHSWEHAAATLSAFIRFHDPLHVWIQGADFDRPIIETFLAAQNVPLPWKFSKSRDARTTWATAFPGKYPEKRPHHAVPDARATLKDTLTALAALNRTSTF